MAEQGLAGGRGSNWRHFGSLPNILTYGRILAVPALVASFFVTGDWGRWLAMWIFIAAGVSDFLDGYLARRWNQVTALGRVLDPAADRMLTVVVVIGLAIREVIPWWLVAILLARDVMVGVAILVGRMRGLESPQVTFAGKAATFGLYVTLPLAFLAYERWDSLHVLAIAGACVAAVLYWISGLGYVADVARRSHPREDGASVVGSTERLG